MLDVVCVRDASKFAANRPVRLLAREVSVPFER